jgi:hypothetical protein
MGLFIQLFLATFQSPNIPIVIDTDHQQKATQKEAMFV